MFNKNIKYGIRKLSVGIASIAIRVFLQSNVAHAEEVTPTTQPAPAEAKVETPTAPTSSEPTAVTPTVVEKQPPLRRLQPLQSNLKRPRKHRNLLTKVQLNTV